MAGKRVIEVEIIGDASKLKAGFKDADSAGGKFGSRLKSVGTVAAVGLAGGIGAGVLAAKKFIDAAEESAKVGKQTEAVIKSTGGASKVTAAQVGDLAGSISKKTGIDDEAIQSGENMLLTFTGIRNEVGKGNDVFTQATKTLTDMSVATGTDASKAAVQLGKALNDPIKGVSALAKVGVTFTDQQKEQIATMVKAGDTAGAQKIILGELNKEFGGSAEAQATGAAKAKVAFGNLQETIGGYLLPAYESVMTAAAGFVSGMQDGTGAGGAFAAFIRDNVIPVVLQIGTALQTAAKWAIQAFKDIQPQLAAVFDFIKSVVERVIPGLVQTFRGLYTGIKGIVDLIHGLLTGDFSEMWNGVKEIFSGAVNAVIGSVRTLTAGFREATARAMGAVVDKVQDGWHSVKNAISSAAGGIRDAIVWPFEKALDGIESVVSRIKGAISSITSLPGKALKALHVPGFAAGTSYAPGGLAIVGEQGPELVDLPRGSRVHTARQTAAMAGAGGGTTINFNGPVGSQRAARAAAETLAYRLAYGSA